MHFDRLDAIGIEKKTVKKICFIVFTRINCVIMFKRRNGLLFVWCYNVFRVDHQYLEEREFEASFAAVLSYSFCFASRIICVAWFRSDLNFIQSWRRFVRLAFLYERLRFRIDFFTSEVIH